MLIFVYEFVCASGFDAPASLSREGRAMLDAVLQDFGRCPGVGTTTLLPAHASPVPTAWPNNTVIRVGPNEECEQFVEQARRADYTLVIAPEFDGLLFERCRWVEEAGGRLLGPSSAAVRLTGDKLRLAEHLLRQGVATPRTFPCPNVAVSLPIPLPLVCKPRYGAGSQAMFLLRNADEVNAAARQAAGEGWRGEMIAQPYHAGRSASVSFLIGRDTTLALPAAAQLLSDDGRFRYLGGALPLPPELNLRAQRIARQAVDAVDGLFGYVGVDVILAPSAEGDVVVEINPRLTTSYVGLRRLARFNLAQALLAVTAGSPLSCFRWHEETVMFGADGSVG
jgi:predicted ATP-grasp superfamily ATP-dependent carboligase